MCTVGSFEYKELDLALSKSYRPGIIANHKQEGLPAVYSIEGAGLRAPESRWQKPGPQG